MKHVLSIQVFYKHKMKTMTLITTEEHERGVTSLILNRPEKRNALSVALLTELCERFETLQGKKGQRVILIRGEGKVFCSGLDLAEVTDTAKREELTTLVARMLESVYSSPLVTIALVQGGAVAGGAGLMSACDFAIAADSAKFGYPETARGLVAGLVMTFLRRQLRERDARELLLIPELINAQRALEIGLINQVVSETELLEAAMKLVEGVLKGAPKATAATKSFLDQLWSPSVTSDLKSALNVHAGARDSDEAKEGSRAFLEKRAPSWLQT